MSAFQRSGGAAFFLSGRVRTHPRKFAVEYVGDSFSVWIYIWTLTPGGRDSLPDEYRIQMTAVASPLAFNPAGHTVLMGYHPDLDVFAGFDLARHRSFTAGSPSVQIHINALHQALQTGLSFHRKSNQEVAVGVRPDQILNYVVSSNLLHKYGPEARVLTFLNQAADPTQAAPTPAENLSAERKKIITEVSRLSRSANFRKSVLNAYDNRCAVTRGQMRLVEAAHVLPVPAPGSSDHVSNGISLSPTLHRAYDNCLVFLDRDLVMRLNEERADQLTSDGLHAGIDWLRGLLDKPIHLPLDAAQRPNGDFIDRANAYRRIPGY